MTIKKRNKRSRIRGRKTCGYGARKRHRGSGHRGGIGKAGSGKRADHKKVQLKREEMRKFKGRLLKRKSKAINVINLRDINERIDKLGKKTNKGLEINLTKYKVLGEGNINIKDKIFIKIRKASRSALDKIKKAGWEIIKEEKNGS